MGAIADPSNEDLLRARGFEIMRVTSPPGLLTRFAATYRHFLGLLFGGLAAYVRHERAEGTGRGVTFLLVRLLAVLSAPFVDRELRTHPFAVQFRRRLERLGGPPWPR